MKKILKIGLAAVTGTWLTGVCGAQTLVSGDISGTWSPAGNPCVVTSNATVPSETNLIILPGAIVQLGQSDQVIRLNWGAIPRCTHHVLVTDSPIAGQPQTLIWTNFPGGLVTASANPTSIVVLTNPAEANQRFFRVQSLGQMPGN